MPTALETKMKDAVAELRTTFESGVTLAYKWREEQLKALEAMIKGHKK
jgi:F0F1-type ATP synthase delta subunit